MLIKDNLQNLQQSISHNQVERSYLEIEVIRTYQELEHKHLLWDELYHRANIQNLCLTSAWILTWFKHFNEARIFIIVVKDTNGNWLGVAPLQIKRNRKGLAQRLLKIVEWIGSNPTTFDWMQFIIDPNSPKKEIIQEFARRLSAEAWDIVDLQFSDDYSQLLHLSEYMNDTYNAEIVTASPIPYINLPKTIEIYEKNRRKKTRLEVNRHKNHIIRDFGQSPELIFKSYGWSARESLYKLKNSHIEYWANRGYKSNFKKHPQLFDFYWDMITHAFLQDSDSKPKLQFSILTVNGIELSYHLGFWQGNNYLAHLCTYNINYKEYSPGTIHMDSLVYYTLLHAGEAFEMGNGDELYKQRWAKERRSLWQLYIARKKSAHFLWRIDQKLLTLRDKSKTLLNSFSIQKNPHIKS